MNPEQEEQNTVEQDEADFESAFDEITEIEDSPDPEHDEELDEEAEATAELGEEEPAAAAEAPGDEEADPYEGMSDALKARFQQVEQERDTFKHAAESQSGRVSAFQKKVNTLEQDIAELRTSSHRNQPTDEEITDAMRGEDGDWEQFATDYPEVAGAIDRRLQRHKAEQNEVLDNAIAPVVEKRAEEELNDGKAGVDEVYPGWQDAVNQPEYSEWLSTLSPGVSALAESDDVEDARHFIGLFDEYRVTEKGLPSLKSDPDTDKGGVNESTTISDRRQRQIESGTTIPSKSAGVGTDHEVGNDFERAFDYFVEKDARRAG